MSILRVENLNVAYGDTQVLWDVNLFVEEGEILALIGANGAGKTTLLKSIAGLIFPSSGSILFRGERIGHLRSEQRVPLGVALVPEGRRLFAGLTVLENLKLGAFSRHNRAEINRDLDRIVSYFPELGQLSDRLSGTLSGGEQQMCAIGRALLAKPALLLIDEMSLGLAPVVVDRLAEVVREIKRTQGLTIILVEQDVELALEIGSRAYILDTGMISGGGASETLLQQPELREAYMGLGPLGALETPLQ